MIRKYGIPAAFAAALACAVPASAVEIQGHRGARGLMPENSLPAFARALTLGVDVLELDIAITADDVVAISHDPALDPAITRGPDGAWLTGPRPLIRALPYAELEGYDVGRIDPESRQAKRFPDQQAVDGTRIPTLEALVALVRKSGNDRVRFNIETKVDPTRPDGTLPTDAFAARLVREIERLGIGDRAMIQSFDWATLRTARALAPAIPTVCLSAERDWLNNIQRGRPDSSPWTAGLDIDREGGSLPRLVQKAGCAVWSPYHRDLTDAALAEAHEIGLEVVVWTVNDPLDMTLLIERGVDGIITDYPDRLREVMEKRGLPLPEATPVEP
ncbi:glycerophosphodiester phosphodiesterase [Oceanibacterium hippocampi]|uniref:Glycerophosphoryl diester phosphodiesterase n=1 Tax=Oceanibacterium hippocampi TaxID=745714 RepID=A0A1Y5SSG6_9PROT|nr:glycerophosphodiester phosphodiesterase [Oceanibacterium hippocampi]SLN44135.1 Glycerophosphoryl diester phosphodiesterase precursor [Oceanibacterium hippocampi]